ncbi:thiamine-phosphate pyrophosphorylase [bacterium]|nr:MAG: thiamine-phosphate pyrophosphorylase [bacterium]
MRNSIKNSEIYRIIDANLNRLKEGLRVCEEINRFVLSNRKLTAEFKKIRHEIDNISTSFFNRNKLLKYRNSLKDIGRDIPCPKEFKRKNFKDTFTANIQRVKESLRVLEEFSKIHDCRAAVRFKKLRYGIYELEKKAITYLS